MSGVEKSRFIPEESGRLVTAFLERFFERYVSYDYTAELEEELDDVSGGRLDWQKLLEDFWRDFKPKAGEVMEQKPSRDHRGARRVPRALAVSAARRRQRPARLPAMRQRAAVPARRQVRRVRRLLQLSRLQIYAEVRPGRRPGAERRAAPSSATASCSRPAASGPMSSAATSARRSPRTCRSRTSTTEVAERLLSLPREIGAASGDRQADHRVDRPLRPVSRPRRQICEARLDRRSVRDRHERRGRQARRRGVGRRAAAAARRASRSRCSARIRQAARTSR